jgi:hypothetical protein
MEVLEAQTYEALTIRRYGERCYLILKIGGNDRMFVNRLGELPEFHHAWQIRDWLQERFHISPDAVPVEICA